MNGHNYPTGQITNNYAWIVAKRLGKAPPYRGYALDLENGQLLTCPPTGGYYIVQKGDKPATATSFPACHHRKLVLRESGYECADCGQPS